MKLRARIYVWGVSLVGNLLAAACFVGFFHRFCTGGVISQLPMLLIPAAICAVCRSFPIYIRENETLDVSVISVLGVYMTHGAVAAVAIFVLGACFAFEPDPVTGRYRHSFSIGLQKVLFNNATVVISIVLPALLLRLTPWSPGDLSLPAALIPTVLFSILTFVINGVLQLIRPCLSGQITLFEMCRMLTGLTPNVIAAMPMGYLMAVGCSSVQRAWVVVMMMLPLMLARYAWKLYLDSASAQNRLMLAFIHTLEAKDPETQGHSARVADYCEQIARARHMSRREIGILRQGAILHDIGKIGITDVILNKPGRLEEDEFDVMHEHPLIGVRILSDAGLSEEILEMVRSHHERYDGTGYPDGIPSGQLSMMTRILCIADAYDAMTSDRPYRKGLSRPEALDILRQNAGTQFDPELIPDAIATQELH